MLTASSLGSIAAPRGAGRSIVPTDAAVELPVAGALDPHESRPYAIGGASLLARMSAWSPASVRPRQRILDGKPGWSPSRARVWRSASLRPSGPTRSPTPKRECVGGLRVRLYTRPRLEVCLAGGGGRGSDLTLDSPPRLRRIPAPRHHPPEARLRPALPEASDLRSLGVHAVSVRCSNVRRRRSPYAQSRRRARPDPCTATISRRASFRGSSRFRETTHKP